MSTLQSGDSIGGWAGSRTKLFARTANRVPMRDVVTNEELQAAMKDFGWVTEMWVTWKLGDIRARELDQVQVQTRTRIRIRLQNWVWGVRALVDQVCVWIRVGIWIWIVSELDRSLCHISKRRSLRTPPGRRRRRLQQALEVSGDMDEAARAALQAD